MISKKSLPILECEVREAILTLKNGKSVNLYNIPSELLKRDMHNKICTTLCQQIWKVKYVMSTKIRKWLGQWTTSLIIPIHEKR